SRQSPPLVVTRTSSSGPASGKPRLGSGATRPGPGSGMCSGGRGAISPSPTRTASWSPMSCPRPPATSSTWPRSSPGGWWPGSSRTSWPSISSSCPNRPPRNASGGSGAGGERVPPVLNAVPFFRLLVLAAAFPAAAQTGGRHPDLRYLQAPAAPTNTITLSAPPQRAPFRLLAPVARFGAEDDSEDLIL